MVSVVCCEWQTADASPEAEVMLARRRLEDLLDWCRSLLEGDTARAREIGALADPAKRSILPRIPSQERGEVLEELRHLRLLCEVYTLDYAQMLDYARALRETQRWSWLRSLQEAIALVGRMHGGVRVGTNSEQATGDDGPGEPLDRPNPRLPFARE